MQDRIGELTAVPEPVQIKLSGTSEAGLIPVATRVAGAIAQVGGVQSVKSGVQAAGYSPDVRIDPVGAALEGLTPAGIEADIATALAGSIETGLPLGLKAVDVRLSLPGSRRLGLEQLTVFPSRRRTGTASRSMVSPRSPS